MATAFSQITLTLFLICLLAFVSGQLHKFFIHISPALAHFTESLEPQHRIYSPVNPEQDSAIAEARQGNYDAALKKLGALYAQDKDKVSQSLANDYAAVLAWSGHNEEAVSLYKTLKTPLPAYVMSAVAHAYRLLGQSDEALDLYRAGLKEYPLNVVFAEGEIRCLMDRGDLEGAMRTARNDLSLRGDRSEIVNIKHELTLALARRDRDNAVNLGRQRLYPEALSILGDLNSRYPDDFDITRDYLSVLDWAGGNDAKVIRLYKTLPNIDEPDYVLAAAAHAYRTLGQPEESLPVYQMGYNKFPQNVGFAEGVVRVLTDLKRAPEAVAFANADLAAHGQRAEIIAARKDAAREIPRKKKTAKSSHHAKALRHGH